MGKDKINNLINRRNAQMRRIQNKYNKKIELEIKRLKRRGLL